jgi:hypothetical protein
MVCSAEPDVERLERFLTALRDLVPTSGSSLTPNSGLCLEAMQEALASLSEPLAKSRAEGSFINPWTAAGLKRGEVRNAAVLATLWTPPTAGTAASEFLNAFLRRLDARSDQPLPTLASLKRGYVVRTEHSPLGESSERVDLTLEGEAFLIGIEVKIDALEGPNQLERYARSLSERGRGLGKQPFLIFLAPFPPREGLKQVLGLPQPILADWRDVAAAARSSLPARQAERSFTHQLIERFAAHVATFQRN